MSLTPELVAEAQHFLKGRVRRTPLEESPGLSRAAGRPVWLKLENLQLTGSFKIRGALFKLSRLGEAERSSGVVTCSAGNHGKAVAYAAREMAIPARVYLPSTVDQAKYRGMKDLGADAVRTEYPGYDDCQAFAIDESSRLGRPFISPYDDWDVMAANGGTPAREVLEDLPEARTFLLPVGGGGLSAGFAFEAKNRKADAYIVGCQAAASPALPLSLKTGKAVTRLEQASTLAGGLEGGIGEKTFSVLKSRIDSTVLIEEEEMAAALRWTLDRHQYLIEPSAAVVIAAVLFGKLGRLPDGPVVALLSGRNVALSTVQRLVNDTP